MDFSSLLTSALGIVSIATLAGLGFMRGTVVNLREQLADARGETKALKESRNEDRAKLTVLESDLAALGRQVRGEEHWTAVKDQMAEQSTMLEDHHEAAMAHWVNFETVLAEIRDDARGRR